jgi:hypothetical protein
MSTIKSSSEHLTLNADGASKDIKFQANGVEKASISSAGAFTATTIDATKLTGALPVIDGSSLTGVSGGKVLQVLSSLKTDSYTALTQTFTDIPDMSVTITPTSSTSKLLVNVSLSASCSAHHTVKLQRDSTDIAVGDASGLITRGTFQISQSSGYASNIETMSVLDDPSIPATPVAITYKVVSANVYANSVGYTLYVNRNIIAVNAAYHGRSASSITVMEIGA